MRTSGTQIDLPSDPISFGKIDETKDKLEWRFIEEEPWYKEYDFQEECIWVWIESPVGKFVTFKPVNWLYEFHEGEIRFTNLIYKLEDLINEFLPERKYDSPWPPQHEIFAVGNDSGFYDELEIKYLAINTGTPYTVRANPEVVEAKATYRNEDEDITWTIRLQPNSNPRNYFFYSSETIEIPLGMAENQVS